MNSNHLDYIRLKIELGDRSYPILIGSDLIHQPEIWENAPKSKTALIVSNTTVAPLYLNRLKTALKKRHQTVFEVILPDGEQYKNWDNLNLIFDALLQNECDRKTVLYALGGGVIGDMTGFAAASYMRGIAFVQVPTTLLSQVDSSVGGKTAINHPLGKNMIGAFYQPQLVVCDLSLLSTLPEREFSAGLAEIIKYGPIADHEFLTWLEQNMQGLRAQNRSLLAHAVQRSCEIKAHIVAQDERESGLRAILNFGHTFAHAIEAGAGYGNWLHGEAVGCGMIMAARLSKRLGFVNQNWVLRLTKLIKSAGLPIKAPVFNENPENNQNDYLKWMRVDKKSEAGEIKFILISNSDSDSDLNSNLNSNVDLNQNQNHLFEKTTAILKSAPDDLLREIIQEQIHFDF